MMTHKKQKIVCSKNDQQQGFTLVEFMVASVLGLVVIAGAGALYSYTKRLNDIGMARVATLQDLRSAATMIGQDARTAGNFGCFSLGRRWAPDASNAETFIESDSTGNTELDKIVQLQTLDEKINPDIKDRSAGVRWIPENRVADVLKDAMGVANLTPSANSGGMLLFYYGEGSLSFNSSASDTSVTFNTDEKHLNKAVESILSSGNGYVVAAGCNTLKVHRVPAATKTGPGVTYTVDNIPTGGATTSHNWKTPKSNAIAPNSDMILQRYKVVAYVVGTIAGEPVSLYRLEFGNNGNAWTAPQQLAKNVTKMEADYLFVTDCPSSLKTDAAGNDLSEEQINGQRLTVQKADDGNAIPDETGNYGATGKTQGPSSIRLTLTYNFPAVRGGAVQSGGQDQKFDITAVVRGGNVCANRKIEQW